LFQFHLTATHASGAFLCFFYPSSAKYAIYAQLMTRAPGSQDLRGVKPSGRALKRGGKEVPRWVRWTMATWQCRTANGGGSFYKPLCCELAVSGYKTRYFPGRRRRRRQSFLHVVRISCNCEGYQDSKSSLIGSVQHDTRTRDPHRRQTMGGVAWEKLGKARVCSQGPQWSPSQISPLHRRPFAGALVELGFGQERKPGRERRAARGAHLC
jgi:hypothetical protein